MGWRLASPCTECHSSSRGCCSQSSGGSLFTTIRAAGSSTPEPDLFAAYSLQELWGEWHREEARLFALARWSPEFIDLLLSLSFPPYRSFLPQTPNEQLLHLWVKGHGWIKVMLMCSYNTPSPTLNTVFLLMQGFRWYNGSYCVGKFRRSAHGLQWDYNN